MNIEEKYSELINETDLETTKCLITKLYAEGIVVFGTRDNFEIWLNAKNINYKMKAPSEFLKTKDGAQYIIESLLRFQYGIFI